MHQFTGKLKHSLSNNSSERKFKIDMQSIEKMLIIKNVPLKIYVIEPKNILKGKCIALNTSIKIN